MNTTIIVFLILFVFGIYFYNKYKSPAPPQLDIDLTSSQPYIPSLTCGVLEPSTIVNCTSNDQCNKCICSKESGQLSGCMTCQTIDQNSTASFSTFYVDIPKSSCVSPYQWNTTNNVCELKNGQYCLPTIMEDVYCNPITSTKILRKTNNGYQWGCICKDPSSFNQPVGSFHNCNEMMLCGMQGSTVDPHPINGRGIYHMKSDGSHYTCNGNDSSTCKDIYGNVFGDTCHEGKCYWNPGTTSDQSGSIWSPVTKYPTNNYMGACKCSADENAGSGFTCLPNKCPAGKEDPNNGGSCVCGDGYIDCQSIGVSKTAENGSSYYNGLCTLPSCVPDPCGAHGKYDPITRNCVCDRGYNLALAPYTTIGQTCINLCDSDHNPCGDPNSGFKRGDCFVDNALTTKFTINFPTSFADASIPANSATISYTLNNIRYFFTTNGTSLKTTTSISDSNIFFTIVPYCDPTIQSGSQTCPSTTQTVTLNDMYYVKTSSGKYLDFINKTTVNAPSDLMASIAIFPTSQTTIRPTLLKLINLDPNLNDIRTSPSFRNATTINAYLFNPKFDLYINIDTNNNIETKVVSNLAKCGRADASYVQTQGSPAVCKSGYMLGGTNLDLCVDPSKCTPGFIQDGDHLCNTLPRCASRYGIGRAMCEIEAGHNGCGDDYYPTCGLHGGTECDCVCADRHGFTENQLRDFSIFNYNNKKTLPDGTQIEMNRWCPNY